jgi:hypothetical protein
MPSEDAAPLIERFQSFYNQLSEAAATLNAASDELAKPIASFDAALKRLNLGISAWVKIAGHFDQDSGFYWSQELGYDKVKGNWGIAIKKVMGDASGPGEEDIEEWPFNEAPRQLRIQAVENIPDLIEKMIAEAATVTEKIIQKTAAAKQLAEALPPPLSIPRRK